MRTTTLIFGLALTGCQTENAFQSDIDGRTGVEESATHPGQLATPEDPGWDGGEDPVGGGGSGAVRPPDSSAPPDGTEPPDGTTPPDSSDPPDSSEPPSTEPPDDTDGGNGRMTGGGSVWDGDMRVTHGFTLRCDPDHKQNLEINWDGGRNFHLTELTTVACWDEPALDPGSPSAGFDSMWAVGTGKLDGQDGVAIELLITDDGEPGDTDEAWFVIDGGAVLDAASLVDMGNHQAHGDPNMPAPGGTVPTTAELIAAGLDAPEGEPMAGGCATAPAGGAGVGMLLVMLGLRRRQA